MSHDSRRWTGLYPRAEPRRPERRRATRWLLGLVIVTAIVIAFAGQSLGDVADRVPTGLYLLAPGLFVGVGLSPFARRPGFVPTAEQGYDEFERDALARATAHAYAAILALHVAMFGWLAAASFNGLPLPATPGDWLVRALALAVVATNLPAFLAELAVPFPIDPEESDA